MTQDRISSGEAAAATDASTTPGGFEVLDACHRRVLVRIAELAAVVAAVEAGEITPATRASAASIAQFLGGEARHHHQDEELHVFPRLLASDDPVLVQNVMRLRQDHGWLEQNWLELAPHVQALASGYGTCDADELREGTAILADLYRDHIELEESMIYPAARARLDPAALSEMAEEMAKRRAQRARQRVAPGRRPKASGA